MVATRSAVNDLSAYGTARSTIQGTPLNEDEARKTQEFWSACNYLAAALPQKSSHSHRAFSPVPGE